jgi:hypothetical protein
MPAYLRLAIMVPVLVPLGAGCNRTRPASVSRDSQPRRAPLVAHIADGHSLRSDGDGAYRTGDAGANVFAAFALTLCVGRKNPCGTLPADAGSTDSGRGFFLDLTQPVPGSGAVGRGVVRSPQANFGAFWGQDTTRRTRYGGIEGWVLRHSLDLPVDSAVASERVELRFFLDGRQHILQLGPWVAGQYQRQQGRLSGEGTSRATLVRTAPETWVVRAPPGSVARLWDNGNPARPVDLGLYCFSLEVRFEAAASAG